MIQFFFPLFVSDKIIGVKGAEELVSVLLIQFVFKIFESLKKNAARKRINLKVQNFWSFVLK